MAKKKPATDGVNKSEEIRNMIKSGVTKPTEVQKALADRGIRVSPQMVSTIKSKMMAGRKARRIGRRRAEATAGTNGTAPQTDIKTLARFIRAVQDVGGVGEARKILIELEE